MKAASLRTQRLRPDFADAHLNLALALRQAGRMSEAELHDQEARRLNAGGAPGGN